VVDVRRVLGDAVADLVGRARDGVAVDDLVAHRCGHRLRVLARRDEDLAVDVHEVLVTVRGEHRQVVRRRAVERDLGGRLATRDLAVLRHAEDEALGDGEVRARTARRRERLVDAGQHTLGERAQRGEGVTEDAIGVRRGRSRHQRPDGGHVHARHRALRRPSGTAEPGTEHAVDLAVEGDVLTPLDPPHGPHGLHVLGHAVRGAIELGGEALLDDALHLAAEPDDEPSTGQLVEVPRLHRGDGG